MAGAEMHRWELGGPVDDASITGQVHLPPGEAGGLPVVLFSPHLLHPLSWGFYPFLAEQVGRIHPFLLYNGSFSGYREEEGLIGRPDLVEKFTFQSELDDLDRILAALADGTIPGGERIDREKLILAGHGKGAAIALLAAGRRREVKALVLMSALSTLLRFPPEVRADIRSTGFIEVEAPVCGTRVRLGRAMLDEIEGDPERFSLERAARALRVPSVIMHGEEDREVAVKESESLYHWCIKERTRLVLMEKVGHNFGADHPFVQSNKDLDRVVEIFVNFISQTLAEKEEDRVG